MHLDKYGFLGKEAEKIAMQITEKHNEFFSLCHDINNFAQELKFKFEVNNQDGQKVIATCLFIRVLEGFQAAIILTGRGLTLDAKVLIRAVLEALILLKICCEDKEFISEFIKSDDVRRLKIMNVTRKYRGQLFSLVKEYATEEVVSDLKSKINKENIRELQIEDLAKRAGLPIYYDTVYRLFSDNVHTSPRSLEKYVATNEKGDINEFCHGPDDRDCRENLWNLANLLLIALQSTCSLFCLNEDTTIGDFFNPSNQDSNHSHHAFFNFFHILGKNL
jgi:hypothetical protein